ncbi:outer membrane beta-barrel protein [Prevotella falsenii]
MATYAQATFPNTVAHNDDKHGARTFMGGAVTFWSDPKDKSVKFDFSPEIGYLFNDTWGVGLMLGYEYEREREAGLKKYSTAFKISPFARWYYVHKGPFNLFLDGGVGFDFGRVKVADTKTNRHGFEVGVRPGACVDLTEGLCLCLRMGFVGYRHDYLGGEEPEIGTNGFGLRFAPEELMIGFELEF